MNTNSLTEQNKSPLLTTDCRYPKNSLKINRKIETAPNVIIQYSGLTTTYKYDEKGHLIEASTRTCHEDYMYNALGQRVYMLHTRKGIFRYAYDAEGKLTHVNDTRYFYDELGRLAKIAAPNVAATYFSHERVKIGDLDVDRLIKFQNSSGKMYTYNYTPENPLPAAVYCNGQFRVSYEWDDGNISGQLGVPRLLSCSTLFASWQFGYLEENKTNLPDSVILTGPAVTHLGYWDLKSLKCKLGYDHLGTVKLVADPYNELVKELFYDSFGNVFSETEQKIYFPLGFAGGLRDIATGFVQFGFRDYDPSVGRFTTPDPALDLRGDGDIYDYCVDDPVNFVDATGLAFTGSGNHEPVRMTPFTANERKGYWRTIPEEGACKKCLEMAKQKFTVRPERPHPNCKCEIEFVRSITQVAADKIREVHSDSKRYEYEDEKPKVYVVGQRPLDVFGANFRWVKDKVRSSPQNLGVFHEGFISMDSGKTLGFSDGENGYYIGPDKERLLGQYRYGDVGYNGEIIDQAAKVVEKQHIERNDEIMELYKQATNEEEQFDIYKLFTQNCQDFVDAVLHEAEIIAREKGVKLIVWDKRN